MKKTVKEKSDLEGGDYKCLGKSRSSMSCANKLQEKNARKKNKQERAEREEDEENDGGCRMNSDREKKKRSAGPTVPTMYFQKQYFQFSCGSKS